MTPAQEDDLIEISRRPVTGELVRLMISSLTNGRKELASDICDLAEREIVTCSLGQFSVASPLSCNGG